MQNWLNEWILCISRTHSVSCQWPTSCVRIEGNGIHRSSHARQQTIGHWNDEKFCGIFSEKKAKGFFPKPRGATHPDNLLDDLLEKVSLFRSVHFHPIFFAPCAGIFCQTMCKDWQDARRCRWMEGESRMITVIIGVETHLMLALAMVSNFFYSKKFSKNRFEVRAEVWKLRIESVFNIAKFVAVPSVLQRWSPIEKWFTVWSPLTTHSGLQEVNTTRNIKQALYLHNYHSILQQNECRWWPNCGNNKFFRPYTSYNGKQYPNFISCVGIATGLCWCPNTIASSGEMWSSVINLLIKSFVQVFIFPGNLSCMQPAKISAVPHFLVHIAFK